MLRSLLQGSLDQLADHRGAERHVLRLSAAIDADSDCAITVHNLSRTGMLVASDAALAKGEEIIVEFAGGGRHNAEIVWGDDRLFGCRFTQPLSRGQLSAALLRAPPLDTSAVVDESGSLSRALPDLDPGALTLQAKAWIIVAAALACWAGLAGTTYLLVW